MKYRFLTLTLLLGLIAASPAWALDLATARSNGAVGEKTDGYVAVVKSSPDAETLAAEVNDRRKEEYMKISSQNSQPVAVVTKLAAEQIVAKLPKGSLYQDGSGKWQTK